MVQATHRLDIAAEGTLWLPSAESCKDHLATAEDAFYLLYKIGNVVQPALSLIGETFSAVSSQISTISDSLQFGQMFLSVGDFFVGRIPWILWGERKTWQYNAYMTFYIVSDFFDGCQLFDSLGWINLEKIATAIGNVPVIGAVFRPLSSIGMTVIGSVVDLAGCSLNIWHTVKMLNATQRDTQSCQQELKRCTESQQVVEVARCMHQIGVLDREHSRLRVSLISDVAKVSLGSIALAGVPIAGPVLLTLALVSAGIGLYKYYYDRKCERENSTPDSQIERARQFVSASSRPDIRM